MLCRLLENLFSDFNSIKELAICAICIKTKHCLVTPVSQKYSVELCHAVLLQLSKYFEILESRSHLVTKIPASKALHKVAKQ